MQHDLLLAKRLGVNGIVIGLLNPDGTIDKARTAQLIDLARPLSVTFHRAFDMMVDPHQALEDLITLGVDRVLTSGQENSALEGVELIAALVQQAGNRIVVMPGGGVNERNVGKVVSQSGAREVHLSARSSVESRMNHRNLRVYMGGTLRPPEFSHGMTDVARVQAVVRRLANL